jgi:hypothetical protein
MCQDWLNTCYLVASMLCFQDQCAGKLYTGGYLDNMVAGIDHRTTGIVTGTGSQLVLATRSE